MEVPVEESAAVRIWEKQTRCHQKSAETERRGVRRLTEDAMPLQRAGLGQIGDDAHAVSSLPAVVAAQIWIAVTRIPVRSY